MLVRRDGVAAGVAIYVGQWIVPFCCARSFRFHGNWENLLRGEAIASEWEKWHRKTARFVRGVP
jgi:hypothetical protein